MCACMHVCVSPFLLRGLNVGQNNTLIALSLGILIAQPKFPEFSITLYAPLEWSSVSPTSAVLTTEAVRQRPPSHPLNAVCLLVSCLTSQQHASVSQGRICSDNFTCCHTEKEASDQTFYLTQSQYTDTGPTSPSADPITPGAWRGSHWSANF